MSQEIRFAFRPHCYYHEPQAYVNCYLATVSTGGKVALQRKSNRGDQTNFRYNFVNCTYTDFSHSVVVVVANDSRTNLLNFSATRTVLSLYPRKEQYENITRTNEIFFHCWQLRDIDKQIT